MEFLLWRYSLAVQVSSTLFVMAFFLAYRRSLPEGVISIWVRGWVLNFTALSVALISWIILPPLTAVSTVALFIYLAAKTLAVLYLAQGAWSLVEPGRNLVGWPQLIVGGVIYPAFMAWGLSWFDLIGAAQQLFIALMFLPTGIALARSRDRALGWLAFAFITRGVLCAVESAAYALRSMPADTVAASALATINWFLSVHSAADSATEWLLALGFVLALSVRSKRALESSISDLHSAQEELRRLVDHDPLTALMNRRALPGILRAAQPEGATILFLDLDDFKRINDLHGHEVGDRSLRRFADALRESFRPGDGLVRFGGDEFIVVARGLGRSLAEERVAALRSRLQVAEGSLPGLSVSVGISELPPGGHPDEALRHADSLMYEAKVSGAA